MRHRACSEASGTRSSSAIGWRRVRPQQPPIQRVRLWWPATRGAAAV